MGLRLATMSSPMATRALKVSQYLRDMGDRTKPMSEFALLAIINDCKRTLKRLSPHDAAPWLTAMGIASSRLRDYEKSYEYHRRASNLAPHDDAHKLNLGVALADLGRHVEALDIFAGLSGSDKVPQYLLWANTAECLERLGLHLDAISAFDEAVRVADLSNPNVLMELAELAAILGADEDALELVARAIAHCTNTSIATCAPLEVIDGASESIRQAIDEKHVLRYAIQRARAFAGIPRSAKPLSMDNHERPIEAQELADREAMAMFEATKNMRARANQAVLADIEHG